MLLVTGAGRVARMFAPVVAITAMTAVSLLHTANEIARLGGLREYSKWAADLWSDFPFSEFEPSGA